MTAVATAAVFLLRSVVNTWRGRGSCSKCTDGEEIQTGIKTQELVSIGIPKDACDCRANSDRPDS